METQTPAVQRAVSQVQAMTTAMSGPILAARGKETRTTAQSVRFPARISGRPSHREPPKREYSHLVEEGHPQVAFFRAHDW